MKESKKSLGVNAVINGFKTILSVIFPLITYPYVLRILQVDNIGKVEFSNSIVSYFVLLAGLGISTYATREGAMVRDNKEELDRFSSEMFSINFLSSFISLILLGTSVLIVPYFRSYALLIGVQSFAIIGNLIGVAWLYSIVEDYLYITIRSLAVHMIALILMFAFVRSKDDYVIYAATTILANVGANVFNFIHAKRYVNISISFNIDWKRHIQPIMLISASAVATVIYVNSDKSILGFLAGDYYVGLYTPAVNVYTVLKNCVASVILVALPRLSNYIANNQGEAYKETATNIFKSFMLLLIPVVVGVFMTSNDVIRIVGGVSYAEGADALRILSISLGCSLIAVFYSNAILLPMKQEKIVLIGTIISAVANIGLNFILLSKFKHNGAAFTTLLAELIMCIYQYRYARSFIRITATRKYWISLIIGCCSIVLISIISDITIENYVARIIAKITISIISYISILIISKNETALTMIDSVKTRLKK